MPRGERFYARMPSYECWLVLIALLLGRQAKGGHKGRNRRFLTEEEVRQQEEKKQREKEWKVRTYSLPSSLAYGRLMTICVYAA